MAIKVNTTIPTVDYEAIRNGIAAFLAPNPANSYLDRLLVETLLTGKAEEVNEQVLDYFEQVNNTVKQCKIFVHVKTPANKRISALWIVLKATADKISNQIVCYFRTNKLEDSLTELLRDYRTAFNDIIKETITVAEHDYPEFNCEDVEKDCLGNQKTYFFDVGRFDKEVFKLDLFRAGNMEEGVIISLPEAPIVDMTTHFNLFKSKPAENAFWIDKTLEKELPAGAALSIYAQKLYERGFFEEKPVGKKVNDIRKLLDENIFNSSIRNPLNLLMLAEEGMGGKDFAGKDVYNDRLTSIRINSDNKLEIREFSRFNVDSTNKNKPKIKYSRIKEGTYWALPFHRIEGDLEQKARPFLVKNIKIPVKPETKNEVGANLSTTKGVKLPSGVIVEDIWSESYSLGDSYNIYVKYIDKDQKTWIIKDSADKFGLPPKTVYAKMRDEDELEFSKSSYNPKWVRKVDCYFENDTVKKKYLKEAWNIKPAENTPYMSFHVTGPYYNIPTKEAYNLARGKKVGPWMQSILIHAGGNNPNDWNWSHGCQTLYLNDYNQFLELMGEKKPNNITRKIQGVEVPDFEYNWVFKDALKGKYVLIRQGYDNID